MKAYKRLGAIWLMGSLTLVTCAAFMLYPDAVAGLQVTVTPTAAPTSEEPQVSPTPDQVSSTATPTATLPSEEREFWVRLLLQDLGYGERTLASPFSNTQYTLRIPEGWVLEKGSFFDLDFSYTFSQIESLPSFFGELSIVIDGQTQLIFPLEEPSLEHTHLRVPLPTEIFNDPDNRQHTIELLLDASYLCGVPHKAHLIAHPTSFFSLSYTKIPLTIDLAAYPRPLYQRTFEPDQAHFVLGTEPTLAEMSGALAIAAQLGNLTGNRLVVGAMTDQEWLDRLEAEDSLAEHLVIVGRPETNRLLAVLNEMEVLPVSLHQRQMDLVSQGTVAVVPGELFTYTLTVTNTTRRTATGLALVDRLPWQAQFVDCEPACSVGEEEPGQVRWSLNRLSAQRAARFTLVLRATDTLTRSVMENTVTLLDGEQGPVNVDTLTGTLSLSPTPAVKSSARGEGDYFFVWNGQAVAERDGIVQELISPWDPDRVILVVTGLSEQTVSKATQALSSRTRFPGLSGPVALVNQVRPPESVSEAPTTTVSFADLGYGDKTVTGSNVQEITYYFFLPSNWSLTDASYLELSFRHSQLVNPETSSSLTVLLRDTPLVSVPLDEESALGNVLRIPIPPSVAYPGRDNKLTLRVAMSALDVCANTDSVDLWLTVNGDSYLYLDHQEETGQHLGLDFYPRPFDRDPNLSDVLFALPTESSSDEWGMALRLAAALGDAADGSAMMPSVALGAASSVKDLGGYHIISLGRPTANLWLQEVNTQLPQPFRPGSDQIEQHIDQVSLRLSADLSLGLVQLISSPWNETRAFLAVTGTTDESVEWAVDALINHPWDLKGNLSFIQEDQVKATDTRGLTRGGVAAVVATAIPEMTPAAITTTMTTTMTATTTVTTTAVAAIPVTPSPMPTAEALQYVSAKPARPAWLMPLVGVTGLVVVASFAIAFWQARKRRATPYA